MRILAIVRKLEDANIELFRTLVEPGDGEHTWAVTDRSFVITKTKSKPSCTYTAPKTHQETAEAMNSESS